MSVRAREVINTPKAPAAIGPYSQAIKVQGMLYVSGQIPIDPATGAFSGTTIEVQAKTVFENLKAIVEAGGCEMKDVVKCTVLLADMGDFGKVNEIYATYFSTPYPGRAAFAVKALPMGALVEIECIAAVPS
ncbi:putative endoribonuclease L-PSP [Pavlovales sp. CCMP2436]|nr:putative endoribonuclease L-PSP [Pavlovales sp. CCMP2436]